MPRLSTFQKNNPTIMVHVTTRQTPINYDSEPFDAAVFHVASHWPGTISYHLMDADIVAVASPKLKARRAIKTPADVAKFPLLHKTGSPSRWAGWMAEAGVTLDEAPHGHAYENFAMIALAAIAGLGLALLPRYLVDDDIAAKRLEIVPGEFVDIKSSYYLILPEIRSGSSAVQSFAKWLIAEAQAFNAADDAQPRKKEPIRRTNGKLKLPLRNGIAEYPRVAG